MKERLDKEMRRAAKAFRNKASADGEGSPKAQTLITDNFHVLEICAESAAADCRKIMKTKKGSEKFPGLFKLCREICKNGSVPDENGLIDTLAHTFDCFETEHFVQALTAALVEYAFEGIKKDDSRLISNSVLSLRRIGDIDFERVFGCISRTEKLLCADPQGVYPELDEASKAVYRKTVSINAAKSGKSEEKYIAELLVKAKNGSKHIGEYVFHQKKRNNGVYLILELVLPVLFAVSSAILARSALFGLLTAPAFRVILKYLIDRTVAGKFSPVRLLRFKNTSERVLKTHTLITVSTLLPSPEKMLKLEEHLEKLYLSNCGGNIGVCCLADFKGAQKPSKPEDKTAVRAAMQAFDRLNAKYSGGFILAVRPREFSKTQDEFTGRERKRGAVSELIKAIKGNAKGFSIIYGDKQNLTKVKYLITLDADTDLDFDAAKELIAIAEHPLNRPVVDSAEGRVTAGYGIIAPSVENRINYSDCTLFEKIMAGSNGVSVYDSLSVEKYQALFGESIYCGKGIVDVDAYYSLVKNLPEEQILSHDIIESGYLRTGFASDVRITESFPRNIDTYFARLHRWVRGDWQNIMFIFGKNPLNAVSRYKLLDNLIRSLSTPACLASIAASVFTGGAKGAFIAAFSALAIVLPDLLSGAESLIRLKFPSFSGLSFSNSLPVGLSAFSRAFLALSFSATESLVCLDACFKALWRTFISRKKLLEWVPAANVEASSALLTPFLLSLPCVAAFILLFASGMPVHRLIAFIILVSVPILFVNGKKETLPREQLSGAGRKKLEEYTAAMWGFFEEHCNEKTNYLPPDNVQFSPKKAVAVQTSPTNIGLMLLSFLAARDFGFIDSNELFEKLDRSLSTVEKLKKYKGNLYNWYNVADCSVLKPEFISTVDSGNFLCCLTALKEGLKEYSAECTALSGAANRINKLINSTELDFLYNKRRNLFYIGIDPVSGRKSESCYDLLMSEARMTSYFAVARRYVPKRHWASLGRILVSQGRYSGLISWTGTAFEYFMPEIFMPSPKGSVSYESLCFCLRSQRKRAKKRPFGFSESGFYAFDGSLNYQYKAHGVQKTGLRRGLNGDFVVSPYSSFLTLTTAPNVSLKNLMKLEKLGVYGKFGFYEAIDYTRGRAESREGSVVRSFMAHHVGMSFLSADNMLNGRCIQRRFMADRFMKGAECLFEEQVLTDSRIFKDIRHTETPRIREKTVKESIVSVNPSPERQNVCIYSNGRLSSCVTDTGCGFLLFNGLDVTVRCTDPLERPQGIFAVFKTENRIIPFVSALEKDDKTQFKVTFERNSALYTAESGNIKLSMKCGVQNKENCEIRKFRVENSSSEAIKGEIIVYFEPCLDDFYKFSSHPAFSRLFLTDRKDTENNCIVISRRGNEKTAAIACGIIDSNVVKTETSREKVLISPLGVLSLGKKTDFSGERGNPDCCCAFKIEADIGGNSNKEYTLVTAIGQTQEEAMNAFLTLKAKKEASPAAMVPFKGKAESVIMKRILPAVIFPKSLKSGKKEGEFSRFSKNDLWSFGISGDLPIILFEITSTENPAQLLPYIRIAKALRSCGIGVDTVICHRMKEGYNNTLNEMLADLLKSESCELMLGVKGGFHSVNFSNFRPFQEEVLRSAAVIAVTDGKLGKTDRNNLSDDKKMRIAEISEKKQKNALIVKRYDFTSKEILIKKEPSSVDIPWYNVYSNQTFGTMVSDKAIGFTWAINSRENKLTPWFNDNLIDNRGEILFMNYKGVFYDLAAIGDAVFTPRKAVWRSEIEKVFFELSVTVPEKGTSKKITVEVKNFSEENVEFDLLYYTLPVLGSSAERLSDFSAKATENGAVVSNAFSEIKGYSSLTCARKADYICFSRSDFYKGKFNSRDTVPKDLCCAVGRKIKLNSGESAATDFYLSWAAHSEATVQMPFVCNFNSDNSKTLEIRTPNKNLNLFFNSFLYQQIKNSRFYGRTGPYQCSGAYGFRDQLQDSLAFLHTEPELCKRHILRCAAVQFEKGDVLHWWHVISDKTAVIRGIRTRCSDDMLWLPYVCCEYIKKTKDWSILNVKVPYIYCEELSPDEQERYSEVKRSKNKGTVLEHCLKAVDYSLRFGEKAFPLIGSCDWNDGFSRIGFEGRGESVWLAMFQIIILERMSELCRKAGIKEKMSDYTKTAEKLRKTVENIAWNGKSYARAVLNDGTLLGGDDGYIDVLPQAFSVFAGLKNAETAAETAYSELFDEENGVIRLLKPPFKSSDYEKIGYICNYPDGIRENGGQYSHAAVWLMRAMFMLGKTDKANKLLNALNPLNRYSDEKSASVYRAEPYVLSGDVYYGENLTGRAGWTHFTGSAAWYYGTVIENAHLITSENP